MNNLSEIHFSDYVYYDETSPSCLRWKINVYTAKKYKRIIVKQHDTAGSLNPNGYWNIGIMGKLYKVHRVIYSLFHELFSNELLDHINGNRSDNRIINLRKSDYAQNSMNKDKHKNNTSGLTGVMWVNKIHNKSRPETTLYAVSQWHDLSGNKKSKSFSTKTYGLMLAFKLAAEHREHMIGKLNEQGANYTERHGI